MRKLADVGFVHLRKDRTATLVSVNPACCTGLPHAADAVMGMLVPRACCPADLPIDVDVRALEPGDWADVRRIYAEGIATGHATFETEVPGRDALDDVGLSAHRWVAEIDGRIVGFAAAQAVSRRPSYVGVAETSVCVADGVRGRGVGKALVDRQVTAADDSGLWTLQTSVFPRTGRAWRCTRPPATAPSAFANASPSTTASGAARSSLHDAVPTAGRRRSTDRRP